MHDREIKKKKKRERESFNSFFIDLVSEQRSLLLVSTVHSPIFFSSNW